MQVAMNSKLIMDFSLCLWFESMANTRAVAWAVAWSCRSEIIFISSHGMADTSTFTLCVTLNIIFLCFKRMTNPRAATRCCRSKIIFVFCN
ncbi:hypothetical protein RHGRI_023423 [Rhododendron griersonianum]|uniref:Secreted protein n=1 Tax=Rhododendron griersonianum TaxID=479676 RepID=A0AAV6J3C1_9ERIC|nr:hypothetical protein RHGRI_023423 [Rhododendron griersonianum]